MRQSRETSPMPSNINAIQNSMPYNSRLYLPANNVYNSPMRRFFNGVKWTGKKLLQGAGIAGGLYGAYKLGQHKDEVINRFNKIKDGFYNAFHAPRSNYTKSGA